MFIWKGGVVEGAKYEGKSVIRWIGGGLEVAIVQV